MSRIGKNPVIIPEGVSTTFEGNIITVKGKLGELSQEISKSISVEIKDGLLPDVDRDLVRPLQNKLSSEFESIYLDTAVVSIRELGGLGYVTMTSSKESKEEKFDRVLMSVGRRPNTDKIRLENTKVQLDSNGFVKVDFSVRQ